jgi:predicted phosphoadenosine phosphosulfate sulfurtransferase
MIASTTKTICPKIGRGFVKGAKSEEFAPAFGQWFQKQAGAPVAVGTAIRSDGSLNCFNTVVNTT